jgi:hypothetical protein
MTDSDIRTLKQLSDQERRAFDELLAAPMTQRDYLAAQTRWAACAGHLAGELAIILAKDPNGLRHAYAEEMRRTA